MDTQTHGQTPSTQFKGGVYLKRFGHKEIYSKGDREKNREGQRKGVGETHNFCYTDRHTDRQIKVHI